MPSKFANSRRWTPADVAIALLAGTSVAFGILVAFIGFPVTIIPAHLLGNPPAQDVSHELQISGVGYVFLVFGAVTLLGLVRDSAVLTWVGAIAIAIYAGLGIFGIGALMLPVGLLLVSVLLLRAFLRRRMSAP